MLEQPCRLCGGRDGIRTPAGPACADCGWEVGALPDPDIPVPRLDVVYYLRLDERVKIGTSFAPRQRVAALPHDEVLAFERGGRALERQRHAEFADDRLGTSEWFAFSPRLRAHTTALREGRDPWIAYARWLAKATPRM